MWQCKQCNQNMKIVKNINRFIMEPRSRRKSDPASDSTTSTNPIGVCVRNIKNHNNDFITVLDRQTTPGHRASSVPSRLVFSNVHKGRPCTNCLLCKDKQPQYTHPIKWKNQALLTFLKTLEPELNIAPDACICRNCRDSISSGQRNPDSYNP